MRQGLGQRTFLFFMWAMGLFIASCPIALKASSHDDSSEQSVRFDQSELHSEASAFISEMSRVAHEVWEGCKSGQIIFKNGVYQCGVNAEERFVEGLGLFNNRKEQLTRAKDLLDKVSALSNVREEDLKLWEETKSELEVLVKLAENLKKSEKESKTLEDEFKKLESIGSGMGNLTNDLTNQAAITPSQNKFPPKQGDAIHSQSLFPSGGAIEKNTDSKLKNDLKNLPLTQLELNSQKNLGLKKLNPKELSEQIEKNEVRDREIREQLKRADLDIDLRSQYEDNLRQLEQNKKIINELSNNLKELNSQESPLLNEFDQFQSNPFFDPNSSDRQSTLRDFNEEDEPIDSGTKLSQNTMPTTPPKTDPLKTGPLATGSKPKPSDPVTVSEGTQSSQSRPTAQASTRISEITDPNKVYGNSSKTGDNSNSNSVFSSRSNSIKDTKTSGETTNLENNSQQRQLSSVSNSDVANEQQDASNTLKMNLKGEPNRGSLFSPFTQNPFSSLSKLSLSEASKPDSGNSKDSAFSDAKKSQTLATESTLNPKREFDQEKESESTEEGFSLRKQPKRQKLSSRKNESGSGETVFSNTYVYQNNNYLNENKPISSKPEPTYIKNMDGTFSKAVAKTDKNTSEKQSNNTEKSDLDEQTSNIDSIEKISADIGSVNESKDIDLKATEEAKTSLWDILNKEPSLDTISQFLAQVSPIGGSEKNTDITEWMNWKDSKEKSLTTRKVNRSITSKNGETKNGFVSRFLGWLGLN